MRFEVPGTMIEFPVLRDGEVFFCDFEGPLYGMKVSGQSRGRAVAGAILFNRSLDNMPPPLLVEDQRLVNRSVMRLDDVAIRGPADPSEWSLGDPGDRTSGGLLFGQDGEMFLRAYGVGVGIFSVDVVSGLFIEARNIGVPTRFWTNQWHLVARAGTPTEVRLMKPR